MAEKWDDEAPDRDERMDMGLDPNDPDFADLAAEGLTGDLSDDEDLSDAEDDIPDPHSQDEE